VEERVEDDRVADHQRPALRRKRSSSMKRAVLRTAGALRLLPSVTDLLLYTKSSQWRSLWRGHEPRWSGLPPPKLRFSAAGTSDPAWFDESGRRGASLILGLMREDPSIGRILDFGCGCGRVTRHLVAEGVRVQGVDWNPAAVAWCRQHLEGDFFVGTLEPPLELRDGAPFDLIYFDLIYAFSVLTHLTVELQVAWLEELAAKLDGGGLLVISTHGEACSGLLSEVEARSFSSGSVVVRAPYAAGTNVCAAYHPPGSLESLLPRSLTVERFVAEGALGNPPQDLWVLRRTAGTGRGGSNPRSHQVST